MSAPLNVPCPHCSALNRVPAERLAEHPVCGRCKQALFEGKPIALTMANFDAVAGRGDLPVLVDFWATWCGPCRVVAPALESLARRFAGSVKLVRVDIDQAAALAQRFAVQGVPSLVLLRGGSEVDRRVGAAPERELERWLRGHGIAEATPAAAATAG